MAWVFGCGAVASGAAVAVYQLGGWNALTWLGTAFAATGLLYYFTERDQPRTALSLAQHGVAIDPRSHRGHFSESGREVTLIHEADPHGDIDNR